MAIFLKEKIKDVIYGPLPPLFPNIGEIRICQEIGLSHLLIIIAPDYMQKNSEKLGSFFEKYW